MRSSIVYSISIILALCFVNILVLPAQQKAATGSLSGTVLNATTQAPLPGVTVTIMDSKLGAVSNREGKFTIRAIPPGIYRVKAAGIGFEPVIIADVVIGTGKPAQLTIELKEVAIAVEGIEVTASSFRKTPESITSTQYLNAEDVRRAPGVQEDVIRAVALLPGVAVTQAGRNDLVVRGGAPFENLFVVDNIEVPNINHFGSQGATGGPLTLVNIDFVREVQFSAGGFGARYGDRVSSFTNISLRDGNDERFSGQANLSATGFGLRVEGPLGGSGSYMLNVRRSYLDFLFKAFGFSFIPQYWDATFKASLKLNDNNYLSFLTIGALDNVSVNNTSDDDKFNNSRVTFSDQNQYFSGITWKHLFEKGFMTLTLGRTFSAYRTRQQDSTLNDLFRNNSDEGENSLNWNVIWQLSPTSELNFGNTAKFASRLRYDAFVRGFLRRDTAGVPRELSVDTSFTALRNGTFAALTTELVSGLKTTLGLRLDYYNYLQSSLYFSPRLTLSYALTETSALNMSAGRYYQSPSYIWLIGDASNVQSLSALHADQLVLGYEHQLSEDMKFQVEGFYKKYGDYPARLYRPQAVLSPSGFEDISTDIPFGLEPLLSQASGTARGVEVFLQKKLGAIPLYGLISLTVAQTQFVALDGIERIGAFDSRFIFNIAAGYRFGTDWELSAKFRMAQGLPTTPYTAQGTLDFTRYNAGERLPLFHALDMRVDKRWSFTDVQLVTYLDIQNIYSRKNVSRVQWNPRTQTVEQSSGIGILPSIGVNLEF